MIDSQYNLALQTNLSATALTIAGSDPSGGAGLQADLKTFQQMGVYGMSAVTLLTVQNTQGVSRVEMMDVGLVSEQIDAVLSDIPPSAIKLGALGSRDMTLMVASKLKTLQVPIVIDPVMVSKHGHSLVTDEFVSSFIGNLLPLGTLVTPNRFEAERICGFPISNLCEARRAAQYIFEQFGCSAVVKFGQHLNDYVTLAFLDSGEHEFSSPYRITKNTHGTGCVLSALIAAGFATRKTDQRSIVEMSLNYVSSMLDVEHKLGRGLHPLETRLLPRFTK
jgi:hydroxymethylpyrimidine/phosphomethylpyrimidine kinase